MTTTTSNKKKPRIHHLHKGYTEDGKWTEQHKQALEIADRVFNYHFTTREPLPERQNFKKPGRRKKK